VSRNFVFNEDEEIQEAVEVSSLPGLQLEGETGSDGDLQTPAPEVLDSRPMARKVEAALPHTPAGDKCRITTELITYPPRLS
jgi:hypothetical protein